MTEMTAEPVTSFAALFGVKINLTTAFSLNASSKESSTPAACDTVIKKVVTITPPTVSIVPTDTADRRIVINNVPPVQLNKLNHCVLERVLNHVKHAHIKGVFEDMNIQNIYGKRKFIFCAVYLFNHDGDKTMTVDFCVSRTKASPAWINGKTSDSLTLMSENEVNLIADSFVHQCAHAIQNYIHMVFNHAIEHDIQPDYYSMELPQ